MSAQVERDLATVRLALQVCSDEHDHGTMAPRAIEALNRLGNRVMSCDLVSGLVLDCVRLQSRGDRDGAERVWWALVGLLGEREATQRVAQAKEAPG